MKKDPHDSRRAEIIAAGIRVVDRLGLENATMRLIAREVGFAVGMMHYYFDSRDQFLISMYESLLSTHLKLRLDVRSGAGLGATAVSLLGQLGRHYERNSALWLAESELSIWIRRHHIEVEKVRYQLLHECLATALRQGLREDEDPSRVDTLARMIIAYSEGEARQQRLVDDPVIHDAIVGFAFADEPSHPSPS